MRATSRLTLLRTGKGCGEMLQERGDTTENDTNGGGGRIEGKSEKNQKTCLYRWGGRVRIKCIISEGA